MISDTSLSLSTHWLHQTEHRIWLAEDAKRQLNFFAASLAGGAGFAVLDPAGAPLDGDIQELHTTTRLIHSYALGQLWGFEGSAQIVDHGMAYLQSHHRDSEHGGYVWALNAGGIADDRKLAYGQMFALLAGASAKMVDHPEADTVISEATQSLDARYWNEDAGLYADEFNRDWTPFSTYRGMNANMHGVEAHLAAFEATGIEIYLNRAGRILDFFTARIAPENEWRLPEHYNEDWSIDRAYSGDPMFRPAGTTPGHSFELGRLLLQHWDLSGRVDASAPDRARALIYRGLEDAWLAEGGLAYTLNFDGTVDRASRFWWPVSEAIGAVAALIKLGAQDGDEEWYRRLWQFADGHFIDHARGGWWPEIDAHGRVTTTIFAGKPDIYHALQACLYPLTEGLSRPAEGIRGLGQIQP